MGAKSTMRFDQVSSTLRPISAAEAAAAQTRRAAHLSRRRFLQAGAGAAAVGAALGGGLLKAHPATAAAPGAGLVVPIPYGLDFFGDGTIFHVEAPPIPGFGDDPGTVYNFRGASALGYLDGLVDRTNRKTGEVETLPFIASDMRFMKGEFKGRDDEVHAGTFGFI